MRGHRNGHNSSMDETLVFLALAQAGGGHVQPGVSNVIRIPVGTASASSATSVPASAVVLRAFLDVETPYPPGTTITLGTAANPTAFMGAGSNDPQVAGLYDAPQDTQVTATQPLLVTVAGAPATGASFACVEYVEPLS